MSKRLDPLTAAIIAAGNELATEHMWCFNGDIGPGPEPDDVFTTVLLKHLKTVTDMSAYVAARKTALRAELAELESLS